MSAFSGNENADILKDYLCQHNQNKELWPIHILSDLHPGVALADFVKSIKVATSLWLKQSADFPAFQGWGEGYLTPLIFNSRKTGLTKNLANPVQTFGGLRVKPAMTHRRSGVGASFLHHFRYQISTFAYSFSSNIFSNCWLRYNFSLPTFTDFKKPFSSNAIR